jgi:cytochrome c peroxidase
MKTQARILKSGIILSVFCSLIFVSCKKQQGTTPVSDVPHLEGQQNFEYMRVSESGGTHSITEIIKDGSQESLSNKSVTLGRVLFYDKKLSINNSISCGSCHIQALAFADNLTFSRGFGNVLTTRNSMSILNAVNNNNMFWDSRASSPLELSLMPVFNHIEMGMESDEMLIKKLEKTSYYAQLFNDAYGDPQITRQRISLAITQFVNCLFSKESKFDKGLLDSFRNFTPVERYGKDLFFSANLRCSECHAGSNFSAPDFVGGGYGGSPSEPNNPRGTANIGLDLVYKDNGRGQGKFKIPSLRNIELTGPYMHDGRFKTLEDVINHYSHGIQNHPSLDEKFRDKNKAKKLNLSENDKVALISFLKTLTDKNLISNPKFSDPFKN